MVAPMTELARIQIDVILLDYKLETETGLTFLKAKEEAGHTMSRHSRHGTWDG